MSLFSKIRGTIETIFQLGVSGPNLKNNAGSIETRNAADTAFAKHRAADPVGINDVVTKGYADLNYLMTGSVREIRFVLGLVTASSVASIPANAVVMSAELKITTAYSGGATISLGQTGSVALLQPTTDNLPQSTDMFQSPQDTPWGAAVLPVLATIAGAPAAGAAVVIVRYTVPDV